MALKLGKRSARPDAIKLKFSRYFDAASLPTPPAAFGHYATFSQWGMFANDRYGDCVFAGAAHETMVFAAEGGATAAFTDAAVLSDYSAVTGFDAARPDSDQGTDMQAAASYRRKTGIVDAVGARHKIDCYVALEPGNVDQIALAAWLTGACGVGLQLTDDAEDAFDKGQPWTVRPNQRAIGGHYVPCVGRDPSGALLVVTWGRLQAVDPSYLRAYCDEAVAYLSLETLRDNLSPEGFDADALRADLAGIVQLKESTMADGQSTDTQEQTPQGAQIDPGEVMAVDVALKALADEKAGWYRHLITDQFLQEVAATAVAASVKYRTAPSI